MHNYGKVLSFYKRYYQGFGNNYKSLGWVTSSEQVKRFEALIKGFNNDLLRDESIVDFGCGLAHFLPWLRDQGYGENYIGIDIVEEFLAQNRTRFPNHKFLTSKEFFDSPKRYGFIFASGVFTIPWGEDHYEMVKDTIRRLYSKCIYGFAFNMFSTTM